MDESWVYEKSVEIMDICVPQGLKLDIFDWLAQWIWGM